mmetsp:Transcript_9078/g.15339  ORF Transcript_9078/g.15339 Transcript_9078/m.15339 type:complete len:225 (+) Transcript_9078:1246-1920(+)
MRRARRGRWKSAGCSRSASTETETGTKTEILDSASHKSKEAAAGGSELPCSRQDSLDPHHVVTPRAMTIAATAIDKIIPLASIDLACTAERVTETETGIETGIETETGTSGRTGRTAWTAAAVEGVEAATASGTTAMSAMRMPTLTTCSKTCPHASSNRLPSKRSYSILNLVISLSKKRRILQPVRLPRPSGAPRRHNRPRPLAMHPKVLSKSEKSSAKPACRK